MAELAQQEVLVVGELEVRPAGHLAFAAGRALTLSARELAVLAALARHAGHVCSREELYAEVWGEPLRPGDRSVDVYVHKLRSKLGAALPERRLIHTHFGFGYRLAPEPVTGSSQVVHRAVTRSRRDSASLPAPSPPDPRTSL